MPRWHQIYETTEEEVLLEVHLICGWNMRMLLNQSELKIKAMFYNHVFIFLPETHAEYNLY